MTVIRETTQALASAFGIDTRIARLMAQGATPLLRAVRVLGPARCRFLSGRNIGKGRLGPTDFYTRWELDGTRATEKQILNAAARASKEDARTPPGGGVARAP